MVPGHDHSQPIKCFSSSPEIIRLAMTLSLRNVGDLLHERGIDVGPAAECFCWRCFGPVFAAETEKRYIEDVRSSRFSQERSCSSQGTFKQDRTVFSRHKGQRHCPSRD